MMQKLLPITRRSATLTLAYIQYYSCKFIPGRCLTNTHLRRLAAWLGCPDDTLRTIRRQPTLAAHVALLQAAHLLKHNDAVWYLTPDVFDWLQRPAAGQYDGLLQAITGGQYAVTIESLGLAGSVPVDVIAYVQQQLERQQRSARQQPPPQPDTAVRLESSGDAWQLPLPPVLPPQRLFHLLQLGHWQPGQPLAIIPYTIAQAVQRGYSLTHITYLLEETTGQPLSIDQEQQLLDWYGRHDVYRLRPVTLLSVKQPQQLAAIIKNGHLRPHIQEQINPRHAITAPAIQPLLQRWAARHGYRLNTPDSQAAQTPRAGRFTPTAYQWLGLHLLAALGQIMPLPYPPPHAELEALSAHVPPEEQAQMTILAEQIVAGLQRAIRGRDAFFPAQEPVSPQWIETVRHAIANEQPLDLTYQGLGDCEPSCRRIQPLRLEERGRLYYLHAYCFRAEANRTFRLDRIVSLLLAGCKCKKPGFSAITEPQSHE